MTEPSLTCRHAERCGGCPVIGLGYDAQLGYKRGRVVSAIARYPSLELTYTESTARAEPIVGYRTRAKLIVGPKGEVGLYAKGGGHFVVDIPDCQVLAPVLAGLAAKMRAKLEAWIPRKDVLAPEREGGLLRALDLREVVDARGEARALLTFVTGSHDEDARRALRAAAVALLAEWPELLGVAVNVQGEGPQILGGETAALAGEDHVPDHLGDCMHYATFGSFVQAHRAQAARIHELLAKGIGVESRPRVLDLYAGSGAIGLALARRGAQVTLVEAFAPAAHAARRAAREAGLEVDVLAQDSASALRALRDRGAEFDAVVVNPPRRGLGPSTREGIARLGAPVLAYVSCDPETLARDLDHFGRLGYRTLRAQPLDMIPLTEEVETVVLLGRATAPKIRVLHQDEFLVAVEKSAHEPTTPDADYASSLFDRVRALPGSETAVPLFRLDPSTSGVALFARNPAQLGAWERAFAREEARRIFLGAVRGVVPTKGTIARPLREPGGPPVDARTRYRRLLVAGGHAVVRVIPEPGRTHQVRRHFASIGHAVLGDDRYGHAPTNRFFEEKHGLDRTFLHCVRVEVESPFEPGRRILIDAPLPGDLRAVLERFGGSDAVVALERKNALGTGPSSVPPQSGPISSGIGVDVVRPSTSSLRGELATDDD